MKVETAVRWLERASVENPVAVARVQTAALEAYHYWARSKVRENGDALNPDQIQAAVNVSYEVGILAEVWRVKSGRSR
jgi:hypothetical protein